MENINELTCENVIESFLRFCPEFLEEAEENKFWWRDDDGKALVDIFFADVVVPFLEEEALVDMSDEERLDRIFTFLEKMAVSKDEQVQEVLGAVILEKFNDDEKILSWARTRMQNQTLFISREIEKGPGRD